MKKFVMIATLLASATAFAAPKQAAPSKEYIGSSKGAGDQNPGGTDGCGLGWQVTDKKTMIATTTRATTNAFIPPTFGMTTGTLGCEKHEIAKNEENAAVFAAANFDSLSMELAQGRGESLEGFAHTLGCPAAASQIGELTRRNIDSLSNSSNGIELYKKVRGLIVKDQALAASCSTVS